MEQFNTKFLHTSLRKDDDPNVGAMTRPIRTPKEISEIYDFVVYSKGSAIIHDDLLMVIWWVYLHNFYVFLVAFYFLGHYHIMPI
jgi:hypothetical protein